MVIITEKPFVPEVMQEEANQNWLSKYRPTKSADIIGERSLINSINNFIKQFDAPQSEDIKSIEKPAPKKKKARSKNKNSKTSRSSKSKNPDSEEDLDNDVTDTGLKPNLIIVGPNGIGKSLMVDLLLAENGFEKVTADLSTISVNKKIKRKKKTDKETSGANRTVSIFYRSLQNSKRMMQSYVNGGKKIALVFDDVSYISNSKEKEAIKSIVKMNNKYKKFPIIIVAGTKHNKTVNELKKIVTYTVKSVDEEGHKLTTKFTNEVIVRPPSFYDLNKFVRSIAKNEGINIVDDESSDTSIYVEIVEHSQYDIRRLINILEQMKIIYGTDPVTMDVFHEFQETSKTKDLDPGIYEATRVLLNDYEGIDKGLSLYSDERATIPLMVHENYPANIRTQYQRLPLKDQIDLLRDISESISESDRIDGLIYSNQCWNLQSAHGFYSCVLPSFYINEKKGKGCKIESFKYTQDYNKTSIKKINNKVIKRAQENPYLKRFSIHDFLCFSSILKSLFEQKNFETVVDLVKLYQLKLKEIEAIVKIDKIKKKKNALTGRQKTLLKEMLGVTE